MSLKETLDAIKENNSSVIPFSAMKIMLRATEDLRNSGIMDRVLKEGATAPLFSLPDINGQIVSSSELLSEGPLVISFYRGVW